MRFILIEWHDSLPSTNTFLRERLEREALPAGLLVAAREQTAGRGRRGTSWIGVPGRDLAFSFIIRPNVPTAYLPSLPMAVAAAIGRCLSRDGLDVKLKWPNDIRIGSRKLGGILTESAKDAWIVGVGINVNMPEDVAAKIDQPATSLRIETGETRAPETLLDSLIPDLQTALTEWAEQGFAAIRDDWETQGAFQPGQPVKRVDELETEAGIFQGYGTNGALRLQPPEGQLQEIWSGQLRETD